METSDWLPLIIQAIIAVATIVGAWPALKRFKFQNSKDSMDAVKVALEIAGIDAGEQLELRKKVAALEEILEKRRYKITVVFKLGEKPSVEETSIESYEIATM